MDYDAIVIGGGPSGATAAMYLGQAGKKVVILDKAGFPRDKVCGDAQGRKAANIMKELGIYEGYTKLPGQEIYGITLSSPNGTVVELDVESREKPAPGYVHKRFDFDNYLFQSSKKWAETKSFTVSELIIEDNLVKGVRGTNEKGQKEEIRAPLVLGCDGALSIVARTFGLNKNPNDHLISAIRVYYTGVEGMTDRIEIHMIKSLIPGYFWVFPLPNKEANVGLGMIVRDMNDKKVNLKEALLKELAENPLFKDRFKNAKMEGMVGGWSLPVASFHRKCFGNGFLLLGDAASLIDPLSGEGVGNAMISGRCAGKVALEALEKRDFSEKFLETYDKMLWDAIGPEIKASYRIQKVAGQFPFLVDRIIEKAAKKPDFKKTLEKMLPTVEGKEKLGMQDFISVFM